MATKTASEMVADTQRALARLRPGTHPEARRHLTLALEALSEGRMAWATVCQQRARAFGAEVTP